MIAGLQSQKLPSRFGANGKQQAAEFFSELAAEDKAKVRALFG